MNRINVECETCEAKDQSVFCALDQTGLKKLVLEKNSNAYKKGQNLFLEGSPAFGLYCVNQGKIKITKAAVNGKETIIRIASTGDLLGHRSLFSDTPYGASATALEDSKICFISKTTINKLIQANPKLCFEIIHRLSLEMGAAEDRLASLSQKNMRERFAEFLLLLKESFGEKKQGRIFIDIKLSREEMASMIGAAPENLIRLMTEFKHEKLIELEGKNLYLVDVHRIESYASLHY